MDPEPVCGSDGQTHANQGAMVVTACRDNRTITLNYKGVCQDKCDDVMCHRPYQQCRYTGPGRSPRCVCPTCTGPPTPHNTHPVCASNGRMYASACAFKQVMCEVGRTDIRIMHNMDRCKPDYGLTPWSVWSECSSNCGAGMTRRVRKTRPGFYTILPLVEEVACYACGSPNCPCHAGACTNPGQVCVVDKDGYGDCVCPNCKGWAHRPVCGRVGDVVQTYDSECALKRAACQQTKSFEKLTDGPCGEKKTNCSVRPYFARIVDEVECVSNGKTDIGWCYGACAAGEGECCRPVTPKDKGKIKIAKVTFTCPDGSTIIKDETVVTECACVAEPQH